MQWGVRGEAFDGPAYVGHGTVEYHFFKFSDIVGHVLM